MLDQVWALAGTRRCRALHALAVGLTAALMFGLVYALAAGRSATASLLFAFTEILPPRPAQFLEWARDDGPLRVTGVPTRQLPAVAGRGPPIVIAAWLVDPVSMPSLEFDAVVETLVRLRSMCWQIRCCRSMASWATLSRHCPYAACLAMYSSRTPFEETGR